MFVYIELRCNLLGYKILFPKPFDFLGLIFLKSFFYEVSRVLHRLEAVNGILDVVLKSSKAEIYAMHNAIDAFQLLFIILFPLR